MREKLVKSLNHLQALAINIDEMEELINPNSRVKAAYDILIRNIYRWHVEDALALQAFFRDVFLRRLINIMSDVEDILMKYKFMIELKYHWIYKVYNALNSTRSFVENLRVVKNI